MSSEATALYTTTTMDYGSRASASDIPEYRREMTIGGYDGIDTLDEKLRQSTELNRFGTLFGLLVGFKTNTGASKTLHICVIWLIILLWLGMRGNIAFQYSGGNHTDSVDPHTMFWLPYIRILMDCVAIISSVLLAQEVLHTAEFEHVIKTTCANSSVPQRIAAETRRQFMLLTAVLFVVAGIGASAGVRWFIKLKAFAHDREDSLPRAYVMLMPILEVVVNLYAAAGLVIFGAVCLVHRSKVRSCYRMLDPHRRHGEANKAVIDTAVARVLEVDYSMAVFAHNHTFYPPIIGAAYFLKFFFLVMFQMLMDDGEYHVHFHTYTLTYEGMVGAIIHPCLMMLLFLLPVALLNQSSKYLKCVATRFVAFQRNSTEPRAKDLRKTLTDFIKNADLALRVSGFVIDTGTAWEVFVLASTTFLAVVRFREVDLAKV